MTVITLGPDDDVYTALAVGDSIFGGDGNDALSAIAGGNALYGGNGTDTLTGDSGNDILQGDNAINSDSHNVIYGAGGDDYIIVNSATEEVYGGSGNDEVDVNRAGRTQVIDGGSGTDRLNLSAFELNAAVTLALSDSFRVTLKGQNWTTFTGFEQLNYVGGRFACDITGGDLADTLLINNRNDETFYSGVLDGMGGDDAFFVSGRAIKTPEFVLGGDGNDSLSWTDSYELNGVTVDAGAGQIRANGRTMVAFTSIESLAVNVAQVLGTFRYDGLGGSDTVGATALSANIRTFGGDDVISASAADISVSGGAGNDDIDITPTGNGVAQAHGDAGNDVMRGTGDAALYGDAGNDALSTNSNQTSLLGGTGNDTVTRTASGLDAATSSARLDGGLGTDTLILRLTTSPSQITLDFRQASVTLPDGETVSNFEIVQYYGGFGVDVITSSNHQGGAARNFVAGNFGNDTLTAADHGATLDGGYGDDLLKGGRGADSLLGGFAGNDTIRGGGGADTIIGGNGADVLFGGKGADQFVWAFADGSSLTPAHDVIKNFRKGQHDIIDLSAIDAKAATIGVDDRFDFMGRDGLTGHAGELSYHWVNKPGTAHDMTLIQYAVADGPNVFVIELKGLIHLAGTDFVL